MLKRKNRLPKSFSKGGRKLTSEFYNLKISPNGKSLSRFGFVVSKKIDKRATQRNRIKRKFRNCIEKNLGKIIGGYDFLFILKKNIEEENYCEIITADLKKEKLFMVSKSNL